MTEYLDSPLYRIMHPKAIAFWGASTNPIAMGSVQLSQLLALGFQGPVYPIHPNDGEIMGLTAYRSVKDVPGAVDVAVLIIPTRVVPEVLEECGEAGIRRAIIVSAGFGEVGSEGKGLQQRIVEIAQQYGIRFLGPNCIGVVNPYLRLNTTFYPYEAIPGFIGMASQSGSFVTQMFTHLEKFGLGFSQAMSVGNEAVLDLVDCIEYLGECPETRVIGLYIEAIRRGRDFLRVAREVSKKKPIVVYYVGGSMGGSKAGLSHTGALAGPDPLYDGIFKQAGVTRAYTIEELFDFCYVLGSQPLPRGRGVAILTHSGGPGAAAADSADRCGLELVDLSPSTVERLKPLVPLTASVKNPVDLTFSRNMGDYMAKMPRILLEDERVDSLFIYCLMPDHRVITSVIGRRMDKEQATAAARQYIATQCEAAAQLSTHYGKPVVGGSFCDRSEQFVHELQDRGFPVLPSPERAVRALAALARYSEWRRTNGGATRSNGGIKMAP